MKKLICAVLVSVAMLLTIPLPSDAGHKRVYVGANIRVGYPGWRGHHGGWHRPYRAWRPGPYWGTTVVLGPLWYPYAYHQTPPVIVQQPPPVYVQPEPQQDNYWYYCQNPQGFYPYVKSCPEGWMKVVPEVTPPNQ